MAINDVGSATSVRTVTPSDSTVVNCRALYIGVTGSVVVMCMEDNAAVTFPAVPAGTILPVACRNIMAATTATNILALF